jgi:two-component system, cell cycle response regulator
MSARILIIEDNPTNLELMAYLLTSFAYHVDSAPDGQAGVESALRLLPDLIICDIEMPRLSGMDVARMLRQRSETRGIPMLAVTAYAMVGDRETILAAGFDGYLSKPIDPETFVKDVEAFLPVEKRSGQKPETHALTVAPARTGHTGALILVVDDAPVNLALIKSTLEPQGYRVITAETVKAGFALLRHYAFDLILSDLHMSPQSGLEFLTLVKGRPESRSIPFLLCSSSYSDASDGVERRAAELGAEKFLSRPIIPERLLEEVAACLEKGARAGAGQPQEETVKRST